MIQFWALQLASYQVIYQQDASCGFRDEEKSSDWATTSRNKLFILFLAQGL
jgi:hypothetical protein